MFFIDKYKPLYYDNEPIYNTKEININKKIKKYIFKGHQYQNCFFHTDILEKFKNISKDNCIPHIILYGPHGSGKKTIIRLFLEMIFDKDINNLKDVNYKVSGSGNTTTEILIKQSNYHIVINPTNTNFDRYLIQDVVKEYAKRIPINIFSVKKNFKIVLINNVDKLSYYAQTSLRRTMEKYSSTCRFILWCNTLSKVIEPLSSRCLPFRIQSPTNKEILKYILMICNYENIKIDLNKINSLINTSNCNIKKILWNLELFKEFKSNDQCLTSYEETILMIFNLIKNGKNANILVIRELIYTILITNISGTDIIVNLVEKLLNSTKINNEDKYKIIEKATYFEHKLIKGRREIIHLEGFIQSVLKILFDK